MAFKVLAFRSSCSELEAGNKSVDIWKTKDVKCEFFLEGVMFRIFCCRILHCTILNLPAQSYRSATTANSTELNNVCACARFDRSMV